jgi:hypothetical protein
MSDRTCTVDDCDRKHRARGWCPAHYARWRATGDPLGSTVPDHPDVPGEHWRPIPDWEGHYEASDLGRIRGLDRVTVAVDGRVFRYRGRVLRTVVRKDGRRVVGLWRDGQGRTRYVHNLVARAFLGPCPEGMECCHWDGDVANNRPGNLRWDAHAGNMEDMARHGNNHESNKTHCPAEHLLAAPNLVPSQSARGGRSCLACSRARSNWAYARQRGHAGFDFQATADAHYEKIMAA